METKLSDKTIKILKIIVLVLCGLALAKMLWTVFWSASYTISSKDDFSFAQNHREGFWGLIVSAFEMMKQYYIDWQGTYFSLFLNGILNPLNGLGLRQSRVVMSLNVVLFYFSLAVFLLTALRRIPKAAFYVKVILFTMLTFMICGFNVYSELFYWFTGATCYTIPFSIMLLGISAFLKISDGKGIRYVILSALCGIMAMGGILCLVGMGCYTILLITIYLWWKNRKVPVRNLIVFGIWFACALVNTLAPGNYNRHDYVSPTSGLHPLKALEDGYILLTCRMNYLFLQTAFVGMILLVLLIGILLGRKYKVMTHHRLTLAVLGMLTPMVTAFPIVLGYGRNDYLPDRCAFALDMALILSFMHLAIVVGMMLGKFLEPGAVSSVLAMVGILACVSLMTDEYDITDVKVRDVAEELSEGIYAAHYYQIKDFFETLDDYEPGSDVLISAYTVPVTIDNSCNFWLNTDSSNWVNRSVAEYYGYNSIAIYY